MLFRKTVSLCLMGAIILSNTGCYQGVTDLDALRIENLERDLSLIYQDVDLPYEVLTLDEIIDIGLTRNLDLLVKELEYEYRKETASQSRLKMLPALTATGELSGRTENTGSFSQSLVPGVPPAPASISSTQHTETWNVNLIWNILDFGLSYYRARQDANRALATKLEYERLRQNLVLNIVTQYWKAVTSKRAITKSVSVISDAEKQQGNIQKQMTAKVISEIQGLRSQNQLLNIEIQLQVYQKEYHSARYQLMQLMGLPPCVNFEVADVEQFPTDVQLGEMCEMEDIALFNRPELYAADLDEKIMADEARLEMIQLLPNAELFGGPYHDTNKFLIHHNWQAAGVRASWNLLSLPQHIKGMRAGEARRDMSRESRIALSVGVLTQVYLSKLVYDDNLEQYLLAYELADVNYRMLGAAENERKQGKLHDADILHYRAEALLSEINAMKAYVDLQSALEQLNNAMGMPLYFRNTYVPAVLHCHEIYGERPYFIEEPIPEPFEETPWVTPIGTQR